MKVRYKQTLGDLYPNLIKEWHPTKNGKLTPFDVSPGSGKKVWWKCYKEKDHEWEAEIKNRAGKGRGCPCCSGYKVVESNSLLYDNPDLCKEWSSKNTISPKDVYKGSQKKFWWKCLKDDTHLWEATVMHRNRLKTNCPFCSGHKVSKKNSLSDVFSSINEIWHPNKNKNLKPEMFSYGSSQEIWWICEKGHEYKQVINSKFNGKKMRLGCPICSGSTVSKSTSFKFLKPELSKFWDTTKNNKKPENYTLQSSELIWWKCNKHEDHVWRSKISTMSFSKGCPFCNGFKIAWSNSIINTAPKIYEEWFHEKNEKMDPSKIGRSSHKKVWWKCKKNPDHTWKTSINLRTSKTHKRGCPYCTLTPQSKQELTITFELKKIFKNINPKGHKTRLHGKLRSLDIYIPKLNLCIEFDGSYWHKNKRDLDKIKSEMLFEEGFKLIRVREEPLKKIFDTDIISKQPYNGKQVTNDILSTILVMFDLDVNTVSKIKDYQSKNELQNEKDLNSYIDFILKEKGDRNKKTS